MRFFIIVFLLCFSISISYSFNNSDSIHRDLLLNHLIQESLNHDKAYYNLPGLSVSLKLPGEAISRNYVTGYSSIAKINKITPNTLFQMGSITKTITATLIMKLIEEKKLHLNDTLHKWLPQYPRWQGISIKNLLNHTSGVYNYTHGESFDIKLRNHRQKHWSLKELVDIAYHHPDKFKPGQQYQYTNTDYILLGMILEKIMQQSLPQIFEEFFNKWHLNNTLYLPFGYPLSIKHKLAHGYNRDGTFAMNTDVTDISLSYTQSAGALIATPSDVLNFLNQLFSGKIISEKSLNELMTIIAEETGKVIDINHIQKNNMEQNTLFTEVGAGLGMGLIYFPGYGFTWAHAGGTLGYESFYAYNPCNGIYIMLSYNVKPKQPYIFIEIATHLFKVLHDSMDKE